MRTNRVYVDQPLAGAGEITVDGATAHYLTRVLRLRPGMTLVVFDGSGGEYAATLGETGRDKARIALGSHDDREAESALRLTLAQGVARGERMDQVLQKATELGVTHIVPLLTDHGVVRLDAARAEKRHAHWLRVVIHACQQCGRNRVPSLSLPARFDDWLTGLPASGARLMLQPGATATLQTIGERPQDGNATVLIGPEGGLSERERDVARQNGFESVSMGPRILRTETAAMASLAVLQSRWGDAG